MGVVVGFATIFVVGEALDFDEVFLVGAVVKVEGLIGAFVKVWGLTGAFVNEGGTVGAFVNEGGTVGAFVNEGGTVGAFVGAGVCGLAMLPRLIKSCLKSLKFTDPIPVVGSQPGVAWKP